MDPRPKDDLLAFTAFPVHQPPRARQPGDQAPHRRRRRLPQPRSPDPPGRGRPGRTTRRMAGRPNAATSQRPPWPRSADTTPRGWSPENSSPHHEPPL